MNELTVQSYNCQIHLLISFLSFFVFLGFGVAMVLGGVAMDFLTRNSFLN